MKRIQIIDSHTGGEPTRLVIDGFPDLGTGSMAERRALLAQQHDAWRAATVLEPRGNDVIVGALLCAPQDPANTAGVIFFNNTEFGLASYFYSRDVGRIFRVGEALEYGMVGINVGILATEHVPFGGVKQSGLGREGSHHGMDDYVEIKYLCLGDILEKQ